MTRLGKSILIPLLVLPGFIFAEPPVKPGKVKATALGARDKDTFTRSIKFPYNASDTRRNKIVSNFAKLKTCMNKNEIKNLLGDPDYGYQNYGAKGNQPWKGSGWDYILKRKTQGGDNSDVAIQLFFDKNDKATRITPLLISNAKEKHSYYCQHYSASEKRKKHLLTAVSKLKLCMESGDVRKLLGSPDHYPRYKPDGSRADQENGSSWKYVLKTEKVAGQYVGKGLLVYLENDKVRLISPDQTMKVKKQGSYKYRCR